MLSTGMATVDEIRQAVDVLRQAGCLDLTVLHCVSGYPAPGNEQVKSFQARGQPVVSLDTKKMEEVNLYPADFHGQDWNYTIEPKKTKSMS